MSQRLRYVECPRDAWQSLPHVLPTDTKIAFATALLEAGFTELDLVSFVSPEAVPQMADSEDVLAGLTIPSGADIIGIIGNERGYDRALATQRVTTVAYPHSANETFQKRNLNSTVANSWQRVHTLTTRAHTDGLNMQVYLSMGFGNPYGEAWSATEIAELAATVRELTGRPAIIADTAGTATPERIAAVLNASTRYGLHAADIGLHLHAAPHQWQALLQPAIAHGITWFEGALAGQGGCPFAADELVGNLPTEQVVPHLLKHGYHTTIDHTQLATLSQRATTLA